MSQFLKEYGTTEGPVGVPMTDEQAFALDAALKALPAEDRTVKRASSPASLLTLDLGERADVSWITTEAVDRHGEIVLAKGLNDSHYRLNPLVALNHAYWMPPVGKAVHWEQRSERGRKGVVAKTHYPMRPEVYPADSPWRPDECLGLIQAGLLNGKSIGFVTLKKRAPTEDEIQKNPALAKVGRIVEEWMLVEYSVCSLGVNPETVVQAVSKSLALDVPPEMVKALGWSVPAPAPPPPPQTIPFVTLATLEERLQAEVEALDLTKLSEAALADALNRHRGRV